jgi:hypothetical protein
MYRIEKVPTGFLLTFGGLIGKDEMLQWLDESLGALQGAVPPFGVIIDMRTLVPLRPEVQATMVQGQKAYMDFGMQRSAVILANVVTTSQFKRLAKESGIYAFERYINAGAVPAWRQVAEAWVAKGVDPDA